MRFRSVPWRLAPFVLAATLAASAAMAQQPAEAPAPAANAAEAAAAAPAPAEGSPTEAVPAVELPEPAKSPGWLGVGLENLEGDAARTAGFEGPVARVRHTFRASPAEGAGIVRGDVVLEVGDVRLRTGMKEMIARVKSHEVGTTLRLLVRRGGEDREVSVTLGDVPDRKKMVESEWLGQAVPALPLQDLTTRKPIALDGMRGKVVLIDAWATWCGPCKRAMPLLEELQKQYALKGLKVIGASDEERPVLEAFVRNRPVGYQVAHDPEASLAGTLYVASLPTFFVVDKKGVIRAIKYGTQGAQELEAALKPLLEE